MVVAKAQEKMETRNEYLKTNVERGGESRSDVICMNPHASRHGRSVLQFEAMGEEAPPYLGW